MNQRTLLKTAAALAITSASFSSFAHSNFNDTCNINFDGEISFVDERLSIELPNNQTVVFLPDGEVFADGVELDLNSEQTYQAQQYYRHMTESIPMTVSIAIDAVEIASTAVTEVFGELLGYDDDLTVEFESFFDELSVDIDQHFYAADGTFHMNSRDFEDGNWVDSKWENEFEEKVEDLVSRSMGRLLIAIGTEMLWGDGDTDAFEARMENFGESIEQRVEERSEALEHKAEELCLTLSQADNAEDILSNSIDELAELNLIDVDASKYRL